MTKPSTHPRDRLITTAAKLVHQQGWNATGINQILTDAGIPKGSFYYYFESKEALGVAVVRHHFENIQAVIRRTLLAKELSVDLAIYELLNEYLRSYEHGMLRYGCPVASLASEIAMQSPPLLHETNKVFLYLEECWKTLALRGQEEGFIATDIPAADLARVAVMLIHGAGLALKCSADFTPMTLAHSAIHSLFFRGSAKVDPRIIDYKSDYLQVEPLSRAS